VNERGPIWEIVEPFLRGMKQSGSSNATAFCPFHEDRKGRSFAVNTQNGLWICYGGCGGGHLKKFLRLVGLTPGQIKTTTEPVQEDIERYARKLELQEKIQFRRDQFLGEHILPESILGPYDYCPVNLLDAGFAKPLLQTYDIGYDAARERIIYPIRDLYGNLVGVSGRSESGEDPRYKVYKRGYRLSDGSWKTGEYGENFDDDFPKYDLKKSRYLWNGHVAIPLVLDAPEDEPLILVEGYKAGLWLVQCGYVMTVALMGSSMSKIQANILRMVGNPIVIFLDNNQAGIEGTKRIASNLAKTNPEVHVVEYPDWADPSIQPDDLSCRAVHRVIGGAERWLWVRTRIRTRSS